MSNSLLTLFSLERYREHYRTGFWRDETIYALVKAHAARAPDRRQETAVRWRTPWL